MNPGNGDKPFNQRAALPLTLFGAGTLIIGIVLGILGAKTIAFVVLTGAMLVLLLAVLVAMSAAMRAQPKSEVKTVPQSVASAWVTSPTKKCENVAPIYWRAAKPDDQNAVFVNPDHKFQEILGFGAAMTDASCKVIAGMPDLQRAQLLNELFHEREMNLNVCRTSIGASDYSASLYSYDEGERDEDLTRFSIAHDLEYIVPLLREARAVNPGLFLFASPWSPPGWMKANKSMLGGSVRSSSFPAYANYFVKFLQAYNEQGVPVQAVTVQNEPDTDQDGAMPACLWPQGYELWFVRDYLRPALTKSGMNTGIWFLDHNYDLWGRVYAQLEDTDFRKAVNGIAWHGYGGNIEALNRIHDAYPDVKMHFTEHTPVLGAPDYLTDWTNWAFTFTGILSHWNESVTIWNMALDEQGKPNIGPFGCGGLVTVNSQTHDVIRSGAYWGMAQFSRFIRRGAHRIETNSAVADFGHVACQNPDGQLVLVLTNSGEPRTISVQMQGMAADVLMEKDSVTTLVWR
jgi:glucosylceramidase